MNDGGYLQLLWIALPEIFLVGTGLLVLAIDLLVLNAIAIPQRRTMCSVFASAGCLASILLMFAFSFDGPSPWGMLQMDALTRVVTTSIVMLTVLSIWTGPARPAHLGEYLALMLFSAAGMMLLVSARDLLMIFVSLELSTVPLYVLAAFDKHNDHATRSALNYFLIGGTSAAVTLFGFSLIYGVTGSTSISEIAVAVVSNPFDPMFSIATVMVVAGIGFKLALAPFHLWAPEIYKRAPLSSTTFIASASKVAAMFILAVFLVGATDVGSARLFGSTASGTVAILASFSIILGTLAAAVQKDLRLLLAYSAIANAGYLMLGVLTSQIQDLTAVVYYAATYGIATLGAFGVVAVATNREGPCPLNQLEGLHIRAPIASGCMLVFMLSLAGIPPLAGFWAKFLIFATLMKQDPHSWGRMMLLLVALGASAVSLYYYLGVLKLIYVRAPSTKTTQRIAPSLQTVIVLAALAVILLGVFPRLVLQAASGAAP